MSADTTANEAVISTEISKNTGKEDSKECAGFYQIEDDMLRIYVKFAENDETNSTDSNATKSLFVLDYSSSMSSDWIQVQNAVKYFVENGGDRNTHFIVYNHKAKLSNISEILSMRADGMTSFQSAFNQIKEFIKNKTEIGQLLNIIFMTDGHDNRTDNMNKEINLLKSFVSESNREITIHSIGFNSDHDREFLSQLNQIGNFGHGIYRYAERKNDNLVTKFEEMFDFLAVLQGVVIKLSSITAFKINSISKNEIDYVTKMSKIDKTDTQLLERLDKKQMIGINDNSIKCKYRKCDGFFYIKKAENMEILTENDLENAQTILDSIKMNKIEKELRSTLLMNRMIVQSKLDKYYELFANASRGLISGDNILSELNSLRHETTFSRARQKRSMNKRASRNIKELSQIQSRLNKLSKPDLSKFSEKDKMVKCLLSGEDMMDIMNESNNNIFVFTLNVTRPEHTLDAPTNIFINRYLVGTYSMEAIQNATRFAIREKGSGNALGGFIASKKFKYNNKNYANDIKQNENESDSDEKQGLFRGMDGQYSNSYLPLFINEEHFKRVEIQIKPILGYFFTLDPLGFQSNQYIGLFAILGHMLCSQTNDYNHKLYKSEWFQWLVNDFTLLCKALLPKIRNYLLNENGFGGMIESGDLLIEFMKSPKFRSKQVIQNLLVIIGLMQCSDNIERKEFEIKFIEELWRRNFSDYFKCAPRTQIEEILEKLIFETERDCDCDCEDQKQTENERTYLVNEAKEREYEKYAKIRLGIIENETFDVQNETETTTLTIETGGYKAYKLINYDQNKDKLEKTINMALNKICKKNEFVSGYFDNKSFLGKGIDGKLRWLMVIQSLRFSSNSLMNSAIINDGYICAFDCLCNTAKEENVSIKDCLKTYIEFKDKYRRENYAALMANQKYLNIAKNVILSQSLLGFCGKILKLCPTRGGKIFDNICSLLFDKKISDDLIPMYEEKLRVIMTGKCGASHILSAGTSWVLCPLNTVVKFKTVIGDKKWKAIETSMHGHYGHRYRESDIPNRHGHCNSNPNPRLTQIFTGFGV